MLHEGVIINFVHVIEGLYKKVKNAVKLQWLVYYGLFKIVFESLETLQIAQETNI